MDTHIMFQTPKHHFNTNEFNSLKDKIIKDSPKLYKYKLLSDPTSTSSSKYLIPKNNNSAPSIFSKEELPKFSQFIDSFSQSITPNRSSKIERDIDVISNGNIIDSNIKNKDYEQDIIQKQQHNFGNYENPMLFKFNQRIINKELELKRVISNFIIIFIWKLLVKFFGLFFNYTILGSKLKREIWKFISVEIIFKINPHTNLNSLWFFILKFENINHLIHLVVVFNILFSLWKVLIKSQNMKINDLKLNNKQKQLLGIEGIPYSDQIASKQAKVVEEIQQAHLAKYENPNSVDNLKQAPFLFKSLQTPLKLKTEVDQCKSYSAPVNKVNSFIDLNQVFLDPNISLTQILPPEHIDQFSTDVQRHCGTGYIPSHKYAYLMNSPSPRKRL